MLCKKSDLIEKKHQVHLYMELAGRAIVFNMSQYFFNCEVSSPHVTILYRSEGFSANQLERVNSVCRTFVTKLYKKDLSLSTFAMTLHRPESASRHLFVGAQVREIVQKLRNRFSYMHEEKSLREPRVHIKLYRAKQH